MADEENLNEVKEEVKKDAADIAPFDPSKKKKKKKVVIQDPTDETVDQLVEKTESLAVPDGLDTAFSGLKKKKKKQAQTDLLDDEKENAVDDLDESFGDDEEGEGIVLQQRLPWEGTDRDYEYEELLGRVFNILREHNLELAGDIRRTVHFIVAACENMISGTGMRPGDIITASNGNTIADSSAMVIDHTSHAVSETKGDHTLTNSTSAVSIVILPQG